MAVRHPVVWNAFDLTAEVSDDVRRQIFLLKRPGDWDGEDADPITDAACQNAISFLEHRDPVVPIPQIRPAVTGTISMHWKNGMDRLLVQVGEDPSEAYFQWAGAGGKHEHGSKAAESLMRQVRTMYG